MKIEVSESFAASDTVKFRNKPRGLYFSFLSAMFQVQAPGGLYLEGQFNGGFFALPLWGAYIWRGLYMEGLIFRILR